MVSGRKWKNDLLMPTLFQHGQWYPLPLLPKEWSIFISAKVFLNISTSPVLGVWGWNGSHWAESNPAGGVRGTGSWLCLSKVVRMGSWWSAGSHRSPWSREGDEEPPGEQWRLPVLLAFHHQKLIVKSWQERMEDSEAQVSGFLIPSF